MFHENRLQADSLHPSQHHCSVKSGQVFLANEPVLSSAHGDVTVTELVVRLELAILQSPV